MDHRKALRLIQHAEVAGLNTPVFEQGIARIDSTHERIFQHFIGLTVIKLGSASGKFGSTLGTSNRIFTLKSDPPTEQGTEFQYGVDPLGELEKLKSDQLIHSQDNVLTDAISMPKTHKYNRNTVYEQTYPGAFRTGDIVEMQASLVVIKTHQNMLKVTCRLHALTLLDNSFTKEIGTISHAPVISLTILIINRSPPQTEQHRGLN
ncbi:hypothetical protein FB451DRAFT_1057947 [Mycena latifolia]|nr:hypothetical protein FB451DRAFT_1057947 [Mycena latifolia]